MALPGQVIDDCRRMGFRGCVMVGKTQLLALREALRHMGCLGWPRQEDFRVVPGIELKLQVKKQSVSCVMIARDQRGWKFLLDCMTRLPGGSDGLELYLDEVAAIKGHVILLVRPEGAALKLPVLQAIARAMQARVPIDVGRGWTERVKEIPTIYLALPRRNRVHEELGKNSGIRPVAAPDIHCTRLGYEALLADWREVLELKPLNSHRCLTLNSCDAVVRRFPGGRKLLERTAHILDAIEDFDFFLHAEPDEGVTQQLTNLAYTGPRSAIYVAAPAETYLERLQEELSVIEGAGMDRQFVAAATIGQWMRSANVPSVLFHGHLGNSLTARVLSLTEIDPIRDGLLFRNFRQPRVVRRPSIDLTFGAGAQQLLDAHLAQDYTCLDRPLQVAYLDLEACAEKVSKRLKLDEGERKALLKAMKKANSKGGTGSPMVDTTFPKAPRLRRAKAITPILAKLPSRIEPHPTNLLANPWRPISQGHRIAPVSHEDASAFGYLPITITIDPAQDRLSLSRLALTVPQQEAVLEAIQDRDHSKALSLAIDLWMSNKRLMPSGPLEVQLMLGPGRPKTFADLVVLHGFLQDEDINHEALLAYFKLDRRDSGYWFSKHPLLKPIMAGTRGQILWGEQCSSLMMDGLRLTREEANGFMDEARADRPGAIVRWQAEAQRIKRNAQVPRNPPIPDGVILNVAQARSSERKKLYGHAQTGEHPPMSVKMVEALHVGIGEALGKTYSKAEAIAAALREYEQALLQLV